MKESVPSPIGLHGSHQWPGQDLLMVLEGGRQDEGPRPMAVSVGAVVQMVSPQCFHFTCHICEDVEKLVLLCDQPVDGPV